MRAAVSLHKNAPGSGGGGGGYGAGLGGGTADGSGSGGGGGGSSFLAAAATNTSSAINGTGNGQVTISWNTTTDSCAPVFAGTPGKANCYGQSVAALNNQYGNQPAAAVALGYPSVQALHDAIHTFCGS